MKKVIFALMFFGIVASCTGQAGGGAKGKGADAVRVLAVSDFKKAIDKKGVQLVDVRTPGEFSQGHIEGAANIDVEAAGFKEAVAGLDKNKPVAVYCRRGGRSHNASLILKEMGFKKIYDLKGGYTAWTAEK